jgi:hypothetical protein
VLQVLRRLPQAVRLRRQKHDGRSPRCSEARPRR